MIDFLIFYEVKNREFESIVLLKNQLVRMGYSANYVSYFQIEDQEIIRKYKNQVRIAIVPSLYHNDEIINIVYHIAGKVKNIVNLRWEQVFTNKTERDIDNYVIPKDGARIAIHCCWGDFPKQMLLNAGINSSNLRKTGPMHMDILRNNFKSYFMSRKVLFDKYHINQDAPCILFISSFTSVTFTDREIESYIRQVGEKERPATIARINRNKESYKTIIDWLYNCANKYDCTVIYRPHPSENITDVLLKLTALPNVKIISEENVKQWILVSDAIYTWVSTSIVESHFAHKSCAILRPIPIPVEEDMSCYLNAQFIETKQQFLNHVYSCCIQKNDNEEYIDTAILNKYYDVEPEMPSYIRTAYVCKDVLENNYYFPWNNVISSEYKLDIKLKIGDLLKSGYRHILYLFVCLEHRGIPIPKKLTSRVNNFKISNEKQMKNIIRPEEFTKLEKILEPLM